MPERIQNSPISVGTKKGPFTIKFNLMKFIEIIDTSKGVDHFNWNTGLRA